MKRLSLTLGLTALLNAVAAVHVPMSGRQVERSSPTSLRKRTSVSGSTEVDSYYNMAYSIDVTLGGVPLSLMIDTGSSDLFSNTKIQNANDQQYSVTTNYAEGESSGEIYSATLHFADYVIPNQFFGYAPDAPTAGENGGGIVGLGPALGSLIRTNGTNTSAADPPLDRIFVMDNTTDNYVAILLDRSDDPDDPYPGDLAVCETLTQYTAVRDQPKLAVSTDTQHWGTFLDQDGLKLPNGTRIDIKTNVTQPTTSNATVVFDTGYTFPQVPGYVSDALYGNITGAKFNVSDEGSFWVLPCDAEISASFYFSGIEFPIHPLDLNMEVEEGVCVGAFQPYAVDPAQVGGGEVIYDMILGMGFLRNAYLLIDFGSRTDIDTPSDGPVFIQLLSITNATEASEDFKQARANSSGTDTGDLSELEGGSDGDLSDEDFSDEDLSSSRYKSGSSSSTSHKAKKLAAWVIGIIVAAIVLVLLLVCGACYCCFCRRKRGAAKSGPATEYRQYMPGYGAQEVYRPLNEPSPRGAEDMVIKSAGGGVQPSYSEQQYKTAWDAQH
ncbi:acid protease [Coniophora puteana RWD-64-598 SS2]|uniref:Acid protease n=1 Tax=Coniophora puteana (strain RWD-64-598) TaxID=741705 RepID=A0A5M3MR16_CONPW|nr:acid protease [Coniophora puteana RWD-64-598 SS2]EIW81184.1 acid protease [Coniophora puteana RWD-64-598 SS2]